MAAQSLIQTRLPAAALRASVLSSVWGSGQYGARARSFVTAPAASSGGNEQGQILVSATASSPGGTVWMAVQTSSSARFQKLWKLVAKSAGSRCSGDCS